MKKYIQGMNSKASYSVLRTYDVLRTLIIVFFVVFAPLRALAVGWTPTDGGLVANLKMGEQILLSVMVDDDNNSSTPDKEYFVMNYNRYQGGHFSYSEGSFLKLLPLGTGVTEAPEMAIWTVDTALTRISGNIDYALGGIAYTIWNDGKTLKTGEMDGKESRFRFYGNLVEDMRDKDACDVVFVIPTDHDGVTSFDPNNTLGKNDASGAARGRFNGATGYNAQLGLNYREVYWLVNARSNDPRTYTNSALVTFNTTQSDIKFSNNEATAKPGRAYYAYADNKHKPTKRTIFRLYRLNPPFNSCNSYFFAYDEQDYLRYRQSNTMFDLTGWKKTYTMDRLHCMEPEDIETSSLFHTEWMSVPKSDSTYYYVGWNDDYRIGSETLGSTATAKSQFTKIRELPMKDLPGKKAPAGAYGRMVVDTTSAEENLGVSFEPAGYMLRTSSGKNIRMRKTGDNEWTTLDMWTIDRSWMGLTIKATLMTTSEFSDADPGADVEGWSVDVAGEAVPVAGHADWTPAGRSGYARITTNSSEANGNLVFIVANTGKHIHYDNNNFLGTDIPNQYPLEGAETLTVAEPRLKAGYTFHGWNTQADGEGTMYQANDVITLADVTWIGDTVFNLYAQASYDGTLQIAISFMQGDKRYFITHPNSSAPRFARARHFEDWNNTWQGMENAENADPNYVSTFEMRYPSNEVKAHGEELTDADTLLKITEKVLDPRRYTMRGYEDTLMFYEFFAPAKDEYLGLYYQTPNTVVANNTWAGLFESNRTDLTTTGWPDYKTPYIPSAKLQSTRYVIEEDPIHHQDSLTLKRRSNYTVPYIKYNATGNQFDGVSSVDDATAFDLSAVSVADAHYIVLPDTSEVWRDTIIFGYHEEPIREAVWSKLIGKQLMAVMRVGSDTVYFHPNRKKIFNTPQDLYLSTDFRLSQNFELIRDSRVSSALPTGDSVMVEETKDYWCNNIVSGNTSPMDVKDAGGNYIDVIDRFRISLSHGSISKIKEYRGRWKKGSPGLTVNANGSARYRDIVIITKTYHYGDTLTRLVLKPVQESCSFSPLANTSQRLNFKLIRERYIELLDVNNKVTAEKIVASKDTTSLLGLAPGSCSFSSGDAGASSYFTISNADGASVRDHITLITKSENVESFRNDTMTVTTTVTMDGTNYNVSTSVPLTQAALAAGNELIWSVVYNKARYFIMAVNNGSSTSLQFRQFTKRDNTLYKLNSWTALVKGSNAGNNSDGKYITPWIFTYPNDKDSTQLTLKTESGINKFFAISGSTPTLGDAASTITYEYDTIYTNSNANFEEQVRIKYETNKWLKFNGSALTFTENKDEASVFSWGYLHTEYSLLNNGDYPSQSEAVFDYNNTGSVDIQTRYQAYREYSTLLDNTLTYLCRKVETRIDSLTDADREWKTAYSITLKAADNSEFDSGSTPSPAVSGLGITTDAATLVTTVTPGSATSPTNVKIGGKYVNIVDTLIMTLTESAPQTYRFKGDWSSFKSISDATLKIPLVRMTYHIDSFDSIVCTVDESQNNYSFPPDGKDATYVFRLSTIHKTGSQVLDVNNHVVDVSSATSTNITRDKDASNTGMHLNQKDLAEVRLVDEFGNTPSWCAITAKGDTTITVQCLENGIRSPRTAYIYLAYIVTLDGKMKFVNYRLTVSQASLFSYGAQQTLIHSNGASGDKKMDNGMQQVHENKRILYYFPEQDVELPVRERSFYGWWRWYREGKDAAGVDVSDTDVPDALWRTPPRNVGKFDFPYRKIVVDSTWVDDTDHTKGKKPNRTMGRWTVFHYKSKDYNNKQDPPSKNPRVAPPITEFGVATKPTLTYAVDISNYYDNLPLSVINKNQVDVDMMDTMPEIIEPTLSLREIFELHPWTEMADTLDRYKYEETTDAGKENGSTTYNRKYMEDHVLMAPIGNRLLLRTEQRYNLENIQKTQQSESLLGYFMHDDNRSLWSSNPMRKDTMIWCGGWDSDCKWYTYNPNTETYAACTYSVTEGDDFLNVPAKASIPVGKEFDTVYYFLRARSWKSTFDSDADNSPVHYEEGDYWFNICRYMVIYHNPNKYGPKLETKVKGVDKAIMTNDEIEQTYEVLEKLDFDYNKPGSDYMVYPHPLPWADASYGFTYPETSALPHNRYHDESDFPNGGEYGLINRIPYSQYWRKMEQHGGAENGYMIYCDGMASAGQVAALTLHTNLCAGQQMYFSGYVGNPSNQTGSNKARPNFTFSVQGSVNGSTWDNITEYTTGDIEPSTQWRQILFPINYNHTKDYTYFRVRIYNVAANFDGNDFIIDDMRVFATRPPLIAYQAQTKCVEIGDKDSITQVVLRVDYQGFTSKEYNNEDVYYTVQKIKGSDTSFVKMEDHYINEQTDVAGAPSVFGHIHTPAHDYVPVHADSIFSNIDDLIARFDSTAPPKAATQFKQGYIYENVEGYTRPVMYVVHEAKMTSDNEYKVRMSLNSAQLTSSICAMTSDLKVTNKMLLELNGEEQDEREITNMCANTTYDISMRVKGTLYLDSVAPIELNGTCHNDWLVKGDTSSLTSETTYGYSYDDIVKVVTKILRCEPNTTTNANQFAPNFSSISRAEMDRIQTVQNVKLTTSDSAYVVLRNLVNNGHLILYQSKLTETVAKDKSIEFVVMPILGTGTDVVRHANVDVCPNPIYIKLTSNKGGLIPMSIGDARDGLTPTILASSDGAANEITVRVNSIMSTVKLDSIITLRSTNDPNYLEGIHSLILIPDSTHYAHKGATIRLRPARTNNFVMREGYSYTFNITMLTMLGNTNWGDEEGNCPVGTVPFTVSVVPDNLRWDPQSAENSKWNNPENWIGITQENEPIHEDARFAPLSTTNVVISPLDEGLPYPTIPATIESVDSVKKTGFEYNQCNAIRFMPGTALGQQQNLTYTNAIIDMQMPNRKWAMRAAPVAGMLTGDVFMSEADLNWETSPWEVGAFDATGRNYQTGNASFWLSLYSRGIINYGNGAAQDTLSADAQWTKVTNGMTMPLMPAQGFAVYSRTASGKDAVVRLPKNDDIYYYYSAYGDKMDDHYEHNLRDLRNSAELANGNAGKLAFHPATTSQAYTLTNEVASNLFVFGNPTMGYIDIWGFIADNKVAASLTEEIDYLDESGEASIYRTVSKETAEGVGSEDVLTNHARYLPPMHVMVLKSVSGTSISVTLNANRIVTAPSQKAARPASAPRRASSNGLSKGIMTVTAINPVSPRCNSRLLLGQGYHASILDGEDAMLTTVNIDNYTNNTTPSTPFNIYAVENNYGLSIDLRDQIQNVPLSFYMSDLPFSPVTQLWFTGVNNIDGELVLYDSYDGSERRIIDGIHIDIPTPEYSHDVRYYIRRRGFNPNDPTTPIATTVETAEPEDIPVTKILREGQVLILRDGHIYTTLGQKLK